MTGGDYELLRDIKLYLHITWDDHATDVRLCNIIGMGIAYIDNKLGGPADYSVDGSPRSLLMEYCRYANSQALDVFEENFQSQIIALVNDKGLSDYAAKSIQT